MDPPHLLLLSPVIYHNKTPITAEWLYELSISQLEFRSRIAADSSLSTAVDQDLIEGYHEFLKSIVNEPIKQQLKIPTVRQDLVWHAHMLDHDLYVKDCLNIFGHIFSSHVTSISGCSPSPIVLPLNNVVAMSDSADLSGCSAAAASCGGGGCGGGCGA